MYSPPPPPPQQIVIVGSGIIGLCTAYYLLTSPLLPPNSTVSIIESSSAGIAQAASKSAGGFISRDWHDAEVLSLAALSWKCHGEMAIEFGGTEIYGWRECGAVGLTVGDADETVERSAYRVLPKGKVESRDEQDWLKGAREDMSGTGGIAQLDPAAFCAHLYSVCISLGLEVHFAVPLSSLSPSARSLTLRPLSNPRSIYSLRFTKLVVAAGPWSDRVCETLALPRLHLSNLPGHSILLRPAPAKSDQQAAVLPSSAIFAGIGGATMGVHASTSGKARDLSVEEKSEGYTRSPELFPRLGGLVYIAGENSIPSTSAASPEEERRSGQTPLPHHLPSCSSIVPSLLDASLIKRLITSAAAVSDRLDVNKGAEVVREQFCYRPVTPDGRPIIGQVAEGVYVATGHGPWGITLAPGTGKVLAELMLSHKNAVLSAEISQLAVQRFDSATVRPSASEVMRAWL